MKELKFRAWEIKEAMMHTVAGLDWSVAYGRWYGPGVGRGIHFIEPNYKGEKEHDKVDSYLMQYIGLKDFKNNIEIYESDLLKSKNGILFEVRFADGAYYLYNDKYGQIELTANSVRVYELEIIGNIHKKPELK